MQSDTPAVSVDPRAYRDTIGHFATGVSVITTRDANGPQGMTVNSLTSVSLEPTLLLVCLTRDTRTMAGIRQSGAFVVNVLSHEQIELSNAFARATEDHFSQIETDCSADGIPYLLGNLATLHCQVWRINEGGDHEIVIGHVTDLASSDGDPLVFYRGRYARQIGMDDYPVASWWS